MSFVFQKAKADDLGSLVTDKSFTVDNLLDNDYLISAVIGENSNVIGFIKANFEQIVNISLGNTEITNQKLLHNALKLLLCNSKSIFMMKNNLDFFKSILKILYSIVEKGGNITNSILLIKNINDNFEFLRKLPLEESNHFLEVLLTNTSIPAVYDFLIELSNKEKDNDTNNWFQMTSVADIFMNLVEKGNRNFFNVISFIIDSFNDNSLTLRKFAAPEVIVKLLETGLNNISIAEGAFMLIYKIIDKVTETSEEEQLEEEDGHNMHEYENYIQIISEYLGQLVAFVMRDSKFTTDKKQAMELILMISNNLPCVSGEIFELCMFLFSILEENQTCNPLANAFKRIIQDICNSTNRSDFDFYPICNWIMDITSRREEVHISYWGEVLEISQSINELFLYKIIPPLDGWSNYVACYLLPKSKIIRNKYGGDSISEDETVGMRYFCVDDYDAYIKLGNTMDKKEEEEFFEEEQYLYEYEFEEEVVEEDED